MSAEYWRARFALPTHRLLRHDASRALVPRAMSTPHVAGVAMRSKEVCHAEQC
jgi:hypothetical protein